MPATTPCPNELALVAYAQGLSNNEAVATHVSGCATCQANASVAKVRLLDATTMKVARVGGEETPRAFSDDDAEVTAKSQRKPEGAVVQIDRYVIQGLLGAGGMGLVYLAHDPKLDRRIALKLVKPERAYGADAELLRQRILREAQAMARLSHPAVIQVYDAGEVGEQVFVAMELVEGGRTLADWLAEKRRGWREVLDRFLAAGRGLEAAHEAGIVHRDFKPHNVLVGNDGQVRVTDFGLARLGDKRVEAAPSAGARDRGASPSADGVPQNRGAQDTLSPSRAKLSDTTIIESEALTRAGSVMGTPGYMAPEQMTGDAVDARSDLFSFCVALHEALYGVRPFEGDSLQALHDAVVAQEIRFTSAPVPEWVKRAVLSGLKADPQDRPASMKALLARLSRDPARAASLGRGCYFGNTARNERVSSRAQRASRGRVPRRRAEARGDLGRRAERKNPQRDRGHEIALRGRGVEQRLEVVRSVHCRVGRDAHRRVRGHCRAARAGARSARATHGVP